MLDENDVLVTQFRRVLAMQASRVWYEAVIIGWWLRGFKLASCDTVCQCDMCQWQRGDAWWLR